MIHDQIDEYLSRVSRDGAYRVVRVLKKSAYEATELVMFSGANGAERGPFVRKRIAKGVGVGGAYQEIFAAQRKGQRFLHLPLMEDCYELGEELVVVMEHVRGQTLHDVVYERDPSLGLAREVFPTLCDAVTELHEGLGQPIIHRDLKPSNVILSEANLTLIDFGIARMWRADAEADTNAFGTRAYAPPEQFGYGQTDVRSDVYALGMLLYYLLTEEVPSPNLAGSAFDDARVPLSLRPVLAKATAFDPQARYGSARELRDAFEAAAAAAGEGEDGAVRSGTGSVGSGQPALAGAVVPIAPAAQGEQATQAPGLAQGVPADRSTVPFATLLLHPELWPTGLRRLWRATEWVGLAWDGLLLLFAAMTVVVATGDVIEPSPEAARLPIWLNGWMYGGVALLMLGIMWMLVDWRWLRRHVRALGRFRWGASLIVGAIIVAAGFAIALSGAIFAAAFFPTA